MQREYAAPLLRIIKPQFTDVTATYSFIPTTGIAGTNGYISTLNFMAFPELVAMVELYQYFEITGYKIDFSINKDIATFYEGAIAYRPINYVIGETASTTVPSSASNIMELPGAVWLQEGTQNKGKWCKPTSKQVYSTRAAITGSNPSGNYIVYINNVGSVETFGGGIIYMNVRLYGKQYSGTT